MIILEGTDKAGKTTFLSNLMRFLPEDRVVKHFGLLPEDWDYCDDYLNYVQPNYVLDRFMDSERAYGPVYRNSINPKLTHENMSKVYMRCLEVGTLTLYCNPDINEVAKRIKDQGDLLIKKQEQLIALRNNFNSIFDESYPLELEILDTTKPLPDSEYKRIADKALVIERFAKKISNLGYRGFINPNAKRIIYSKKDLIDRFLVKFEFSQLKSMALVCNRNIENLPVNINNLCLELPDIKEVRIYEDANHKGTVDDYKCANNKLEYILVG